MKLSKVISEINKKRPLSHKEKCILSYWSWKEGSFRPVNKNPSLFENVLNYQEVFTENDLELILDIDSGFKHSDTRQWDYLINLTLNYDWKSQVFFQKALGLLSERHLCIKARFSIEEGYFSMILGKHVTLYELNNEIIKPLLSFYQFIIYTLINLELIFGGIKSESDLRCFQSLRRLFRIKNESEFIGNLIKIFRENDEKIAFDYMEYLSKTVCSWNKIPEILTQEKRQDLINRVISDFDELSRHHSKSEKKLQKQTFPEIFQPLV